MMSLHDRAARYVLFVILAGGGPLAAAEIEVDTVSDTLGGSPSFCSLREAIEAANTDSPIDGCPAGSGADVILLAPVATYALTRAGAEEDANATGDLDVTSNITIRCETNLGSVLYPGIDPDGIDRALHVHPGARLVLDKVNVFGGSASLGGGIFSAGMLEFRHGRVTGNSATASGGGIYLIDGTAMIENATIASNSSGGTGGGVSQHPAHDGLVVLGTTFRANEAANDGGGLHAMGVLDVRDSLFVDNEAKSGGGADVYGLAPQEIANTTLSGNRSREHGGGLSAEAENLFFGPWLSNLTITDNEADSDNDGIGSSGGLIAYNARIANTIVAGNRTLGLGTRPDCWSVGTSSLGYNLIGAADADCELVEAVPTSTLGTLDKPLVLLLDVLGSNGGPTQTHRLVPGSRAIDGGDPAGCRGRENLLWTDQRGFATRYFDGDGDGVGRCDVGAFELGATDIFLFADGFESGSACDWSSREGAPFC